MSLKYCEQVAGLFRSLIDDPDRTFFSDNEMVYALDQGYAEFRRIVSQQMPEIYEKKISSFITGKEWDLDGILFGPTPTKGNADRIDRIEVVDGEDGNFQSFLMPAAAPEQMQPLFSWRNMWMIQGRKVHFSYEVNMWLRLTYLPESDVNWAAGIVPGSNVYIDDLIQFHDLIAILAARWYFIKDFSTNPQFEAHAQKRMQDLKEYLTKARGGDSFRWVREEDSYII